MTTKLSNQDLQPIIQHIRSHYRKRLIEGIVLSVSGLAAILFGPEDIYMYAGIIGLAGGLILLLLAFRNPHKHKFILWLTEAPEQIVWIYEVKGSKANGVRVYKANGAHLFMEITGPKKESLLNYIHQLLPHAHFGYDEAGKARIKKTSM